MHAKCHRHNRKASRRFAFWPDLDYDPVVRIRTTDT